MVLCWVATFVALPSVLAVMDRIVPLEQESPGLLGRLRRRTQGGIAFGAPFARLAARSPVGLTLAGLALAAAGLVATVSYVRSDPMEYDLQNLRNDERSVTTPIAR